MGTTQAASPTAEFRARFPCEPASVPRARERIREWCHEARITSDDLSDVQLAVTEATTNAVRHADCVDFEVHGQMCDDALTVSVWDRGRGRRNPDPGAGLGTTIIRALAESVHFEDTKPGTRVTMRFRRRNIAGRRRL
jgi:anti-sigma regulatory factor (Ser/Thr protein kinase)